MLPDHCAVQCLMARPAQAYQPRPDLRATARKLRRRLEVLRAAAPAVVREISLFDVYHGKGIDPDKRSLAFRVVMQDTQRTLEDAEVDAAIGMLVRQAETVLGCRLRGAGV